MRALLGLILLLLLILFYNAPSASRKRALAFDTMRAAPSTAEPASQVASAAPTQQATERASAPSQPLSDGPSADLTLPKVGYRAPEIGAITLDGRIQRRLLDYRGRNVLLYVWVTWCPQCRNEMPSIEALYREFRGENFVLLAVEAESEPDRILETARDRGYSFELLRDDKGRPTMKSFTIPGYPYTAVIDRRGVIRAIRVGYSPENHEKNVALIRQLLAE